MAWTVSTWIKASLPATERRSVPTGDLRACTDRQLQRQADDLRDALGQDNSAPDRSSLLRAETLVAEAIRRTLGLQLRGNQLATAQHLLRRKVVELPTGEGKTLAAAPALAIRALAGRGAWLATANDYLARRDAQLLQPAFQLLGLTTGCVQSCSHPRERKSAYQCDITYGTIREFGFDFLRDRLQRRRADERESVQRELYSLIVDEADSILLDDARTPMIISERNPGQNTDPELFAWSVQTSRQLVADRDYLADPASQQVWTTEVGRAKIRACADLRLLSRVTLPEAYTSVALAVKTARQFHLDRDYVIREGEIVIVDNSTGRLAEGREWQGGIHQMLQASHALEIRPPTQSVARVTVQAFLREFVHLSGMTGTCQEAAQELSRLYGLKVSVVPPHRPCRRRSFPTLVFATRAEKWHAVVEEIRRVSATGRPILVGTRDLLASSELSRDLQRAGIGHQVLTACQESSEAELISQAGRRGMITVSTSIAGRGTDIRLEPGVDELGGLHVLATDLFDAPRIDRQLAGRGGRQGSPATFRKLLSLEDGVLAAAWEPDILRRRISRISRSPRQAEAVLNEAQQTLVRQHAAARLSLLQADRQRRSRQQEMGTDFYLNDMES